MAAKDQRKFFNIAIGSLGETQAILILSKLKNSKLYMQLSENNNNAKVSTNLLVCFDKEVILE